jgi:hypothetical protein
MRKGCDLIVSEWGDCMSGRSRVSTLISALEVFVGVP